MSHWEASVGATDEWYTPPEVFHALGTAFDLDVSPARYGVGHVPAAHMLQGCGLSEPWFGFVWMNPPFGGRNAIAPWLAKFIEHGHGIALTPDRTSAPWFHAAFPAMDAVLFTRKIRFLRPDGTAGVAPSNGTALLAIGAHGSATLHRAAERGFGVLATPQRQYAA